MDTAVRIIPNHKGDLIHEYIDYKGFGYVTLVSNEVANEDRFNSLYKQRKFVLNDSLESLQDLISKTVEDNIVPGRLVVKEFREKEIPNAYFERINKKMLYEDAIKPFLKDVEFGLNVNGQEFIFKSPETTFSKFSEKNYPKNEGQRIIRFIDYDRTGEEQDIILTFDKLELPKFTPITLDTIQVTKKKDTSSVKENKEVILDQNLNSSTKKVATEESQPLSTTAKISVKRHDDKLKASKTSRFEKSFGEILAPLLVIAYIAYIIIENDRIARMEGSSLWEQLLLLFAAIGIYAIYKAFKK
jgi:hypothetical protein